MNHFEQIENPKTKRKIYLYGDTYYKLINDNVYTENYLLSLPRITTTKSPKSPKILQKYTTSKPNQLTGNEQTINYLTNIEDTEYHMLMQLDIQTLKSYCSSSPSAVKICNNQQFWKSKFQQDGLLLLLEKLPTSTKEWLKEYDKNLKISQLAYKIFQVSMKEKSNMFLIFNKNDDVTKILPKYAKEITEYKNYYNQHIIEQNIIINHMNNRDEINYVIEGDTGTLKVERYFLTKQEIVNLLYRFLYYYPNKNIVDGTENSFLPQKIKLKMDKLYNSSKNVQSTSYNQLYKRLNMLQS
jgi:hypothetical protein